MSPAFETVRILRVFVSSPGDVAAERDVMAELVDSINRTDGKTHGIRLELFRWEDDVVPQIGPKPQQVVDSQTSAYDVYLGIMSTRFGTPTGRYGSGTEKEFKDALKQWKAAGSPWITFYFDDAPTLSSKPDDVAQYLKVCEFREGLQKQGLYATYKGVRGSKDGFYEKVSLHLRKIIQHMATLQADPTPEPAPAQLSTGEVKVRKPAVPPEYIDWLLRRSNEVELMGLEVKHGSGVRLNHVYTPLATSSRPEETKRGGRGRDEDLMRGEQESKQLLLAFFDKQSLYVSGDPGSGKSTFCRWVTWLTCHGEMPSVDVPPPDEYRETFPDRLRGRLPVLVRLRDFWQFLTPAGVRSAALGTLEHVLELWLADQKYPGMDWACLKDHLEQGSAALMLDGVDEVPPVRKTDGDAWYPREMLLNALAEGVAYWTRAGNRVLVTSRPYGLTSEQQRRLALAHAPILGLDRHLQALLVRRWFLRLKEDHALGREAADAMIDHIHVEPGLDDLAVNPLLLTAMCIIYDEGKRLPHDKHTLYDRIIDTVLHRRYAERESIDVIRGRLAAVALGMHTGEALKQKREAPQAFASVKEIDRVLESYQKLDGSTDAGLRDVANAREDLLSRSGLLVDRGNEGASFYHLSIQEFLAAERFFLLHGRDQEHLADLLLMRAHAAGWRNTLSFVFGCLVATFKSHAGLECLKQFAGRLELPAPDPSRRGEEGGVWNSAVVLGDCLQILAGRKAAIPEDLTDLFQDCVEQAVEQEIAVKDRQTLAVALGRLGDPRVTVDLRMRTFPDDHSAYVKIPAGKYYVGDEKKPITIEEPYWLAEHPVTNWEYALFVDADGYLREEFWSDEGWQWVQSEGITAPEYWRHPEYNAPNQPVVGVSWWEAEAFSKWAGVRLPGADEAEAAARGPQGFEYPWGDDWEEGCCNGGEAALDGTSAVGIFPRDRSPFGVMDMAGNVLEWCVDSDASLRLIRGGCWWFGAGDCRAADRSRNQPQSRGDSLGFRVAAVPPGGPGDKRAEPRAQVETAKGGARRLVPERKAERGKEDTTEARRSPSRLIRGVCLPTESTREMAGNPCGDSSYAPCSLCLRGEPTLVVPTARTTRRLEAGP